MDGVNDFLAMGGYAVYVWPSLLITAAVMLALLVVSWRRLRDNERAVERLEADLPDREARRAARRPASSGSDAGPGEGPNRGETTA